MSHAELLLTDDDDAFIGTDENDDIFGRDGALVGDVDGEGAADFRIGLIGVPTITAADLVL